MPLVRPAIATIVIYNFVSMFNELFLALVIEDKQSLYTLPVGATLFRGLFSTNYTPMFAFLTVTIAISVIVYSIFQKQIVAGLTAGALKG
jgi:raffinose/stachyose/melibiose transport system permease protein